MDARGAGDGINDREAIALRLMDLEALLRQLLLWSDESPSREALSSQQPFAVDQLSFEGWLQFIFLPKMYAMLDDDLPLPETCAVAAMAETRFLESSTLVNHLLTVLRDLDTLISQTP